MKYALFGGLLGFSAMSYGEMLPLSVGFSAMSYGEMLPLSDEELAAVTGQTGFSFEQPIRFPSIVPDQIQPVLNQLENQ